MRVNDGTWNTFRDTVIDEAKEKRKEHILTMDVPDTSISMALPWLWPIPPRARSHTKCRTSRMQMVVFPLPAGA